MTSMLTAAIPGRTASIISPRGAHIYRYAAASFCLTETIIQIQYASAVSLSSFPPPEQRENESEGGGSRSTVEGVGVAKNSKSLLGV